METAEMLKQVKFALSIVNPAELSMQEAIAYAAALATIAQGEALTKIATQLEQINMTLAYMTNCAPVLVQQI